MFLKQDRGLLVILTITCLAAIIAEIVLSFVIDARVLFVIGLAVFAYSIVWFAFVVRAFVRWAKASRTAPPVPPVG